MLYFIKQLSFLVIITSLVTTFDACSFTHLPDTVQQSISQSESAVDTANHRLDTLQQSIKNNNFIYYKDSIYISNQSVERKDTDNLPPVFSDEIQLDASFSSMKQIADTVNRLTRYPVLLDTDVKDINIRVTQDSGNLIDFLNNICARTNTTWSFRDNRILFADTSTETWFIKTLPGDVQVQNQVNSSSGIQNGSSGNGSSGGSGGSSGSSGGGGLSGGSGGGSGSSGGGSSGGSGGGGSGSSGGGGSQNAVQNVQFNVTNSFWDNLQNTIKSMLSSKGKVNIMPSTSSVTVTDNPAVLLKIGEFIKQQNDMLKRQVQIDVQVLTVDTDATDNYGINWNLALKGTQASFNINGQGAGSTATGSTAVPIFVPSATTQSFTIGATSGDLNGSQLIINALSSITKTSVVISTAATTLNNQPVPVELVEQQGYVASISNTQVLAAGTQQALTTGQINYGFVLNILPNIQDNGIVNLQISVNLSSLRSLRNFGIPGSQVQLPDMIQRNTMQKVTMKSGETYVLTGFDGNISTITNTGVGSPTNWWLGGGVSANRTRQRLVILVTPRVVDE